jgi:methylmalonyl-CoA/ethylmalonyl-CoA epimerase
MGRIKKVDHIGIAVKNLDEAIERFTRILGAEFIAKKEIVLSGSKMCVGYLKLGDTIIGLDQPTNPDEFLAQFIERRGEGLHHVGLEVDNLEAFKAELSQKGVRIPHQENPGGVRKEILLSPKDLCGVVFQVMEWEEKGGGNVEERILRLHRSLEKWK